MKKTAIIMGSDSDLPVVEKAIHTLQEFSVPFEVHVYSAHRTPEQAKAFAVSARENDFGVIIAAAGKAAHLAGAIAANTTLPVIGIPVKSSTLDGIGSLLSTVQMPSASLCHRLRSTARQRSAAGIADPCSDGCRTGTKVGRSPAGTAAEKVLKKRSRNRKSIR
jgi:5-(carboxyamino)imidazole ribonucleotide mutase